MSGRRVRRFSRAFKLKAVERLEAGESATALGRELGVRPTLIYQWRAAWRAGGAEGLRGAGRPRADEAPAAPVMTAEARIAELERQLGQQAFDLDFFKGALRRIEASRRPKDGPGATASSPRSRR